MSLHPAIRHRESLRRERMMHEEHLAARDKAMQKAREWREFAFERDEIGALYQADAWVKCARRSNHHALACRRQGAA